MNSGVGEKRNGPERRPQAESKAAPAAEREKDAIYQGDRIVARVLDVEVDLEAKEIRFGEVYKSDDLLLPDECDFQEYKILVQRIDQATKVARESPFKGRILRGVAADIVGYREQ